MVRQLGRLKPLAVSREKAEGMYADGGGLYLQVTSAGARSWIFRYTIEGRTRAMGLGSLNDVTLAEARARATEARRLKSAGIDPIGARDGLRATARADAAKRVTFKDTAESYINAHKASWRSEKHGNQWRDTLATYVYPLIGALPVQQIDTGLVVRVLDPIWTAKAATANRVRQRIEAVLDAAKTREHRTGENPARWRGHLENLLPAQSKVQRVAHHAALPWGEIGAFMTDLREQDGVAAQALEFLILTVTRTSETIGARWDEIDLDKAVWTIPATRIKAGKEHRVPLSVPAVTLLKRLRKETDGEFVFPGAKAQKPLSNNAMLALRNRMGLGRVTVHGFRSAFRDWASEQTSYSREVIEMALAHAIGDKVEAAYRRGDLFEKRQRLMAEWARYCGTVQPAGKVVPIQRAGT